MLLSLERLREIGLLQESDLDRGQSSPFPEDFVDYGPVIEFRMAALRRAAQVFFADGSRADRAAFDGFCESASPWLDDYALFMACKDAHRGAMWTLWDPRLRARDPQAVNELSAKLAPEVNAYKYWQFEFFQQWKNLKAYCQQRGIRFMGDVPIYVAHDSADVWAHPELFYLDDQGRPTVVSGVPPDYFSATGQLWGNPIYRWDLLAATGYKWWIDRLRASLALFDMVRLDHFRGFEVVLGGSGRGIDRHQRPLGERARRRFSVSAAEGLRRTTDRGGESRRDHSGSGEACGMQFGLPGMSLLQFAFGNDPQGPSFRPHNYNRELVAYTGMHDNDTTVGWW